jgi:phenylalanyl-tRNA synthetase beta chain
MKISLNSIKRFNQKFDCCEDITSIGIDKLIDKIGSQLGSVDEIVNLGEKYENTYVVRIVSCVPHPDADKLSLCKIDDAQKVSNIERDENGYIQVVCGAPNVRTDMNAAWLPPGSVVPDTYSTEDPFVLETKELRGQKSNGMLASPKELAINDNHDGILELNDDLKLGSSFAESYGLKDDVVIDIENKMFTHRPDCFGLIGISRELAGIQQMKFKSPGWYTSDAKVPGAESEQLSLSVTNELPGLVPRFCAIAISNVNIGPSPQWLQIELSKVGQKSINNIVDYTNYYMFQTGQPLHAYDYDKVKALSGSEVALIVRNPKPGEKIKLINGKEIEPRQEAIMIATDKELIGLGGVMGGESTEVDSNTTNIIIECANFDMYSVRRTSMAHGLFTDAVTRFNKGQSPLQNLAVLSLIVNELVTNLDTKVASRLVDLNNLSESIKLRGSLYNPLTVSAEYINSRLGLDLSSENMKELLDNVEFEVELNGSELNIKAPFWRTDVEQREDVVEEIGRLYGYDKLPLNLPKHDLNPATKDKALEFKAQVRTILSSAGANELLTYSFVHGDLLNKTGQDETEAFQISNAISPDLQYYRLNITTSLLDKVHLNIKSGFSEFALYEMGKVHQIGLEENNIPIELDRLALVFAADTKSAKSYEVSAYFTAKNYLANLFMSLNVSKRVKFESLETEKYYEGSENRVIFYEPGRAATILIDGLVVGEIGEYKSAVRKYLKLPDYCAGFELDLSVLLKYAGQSSTYRPIPDFPKVYQDITLKVPTTTTFQVVYDFIYDELNKIKPANSLVELIPGDIYQSETDTQTKNISFRLSIASYKQTLNDIEVNELLDRSATAAKEALGADRV